MSTSNREKLEALGIKLRANSGQVKVICPNCSHKRKNKTEPCLSVNIDEGSYTCWNDCGFTGSVGYEPREQKEKKEYKRPVFNDRTKLGEGSVQWFNKRGISQQTIIDLKTTVDDVWFPQINGTTKAIQFNYFRNGELINVKSRSKGKDFRLEKDAELIMWNLDSLKDEKVAYIVEGEMDGYSLHEIGRKNVISVPNGASLKGTGNLEYLDNSYDDIKHIEKFIIATDNDKPGLNLREELARRLGYDKCYKVDFGKFKDANDVLVEAGEKKLAEILDNHSAWPITGVIEIDDLFDDLELIYEHGLQRGEITDEMGKFDELLSFMLGQLTIITGIPNHGKSRFIMQICCWLAIKKGWKFGIFSPEHFPHALFVVKICELVIGKRFAKNKLSKEEKSDLIAFVKKHFFIVYPEDESFTLDNILSKMDTLVSRFGIKGVIIDPWNKLEHKRTNGMSETEYISEQLDKIITFNQKRMVHTFLVAHPTKQEKDKDGNFVVPNLYSISGSANFFNKTDNGITVYRNFKKSVTEVHIQKVKHDHLGSLGMTEFRYNLNNGRFMPDEISGWDNDNWLIPRVQYVQQVMTFEEANKLGFQSETGINMLSTMEEPEKVPF